MLNAVPPGFGCLQSASGALPVDSRVEPGSLGDLPGRGRAQGARILAGRTAVGQVEAGAARIAAQRRSGGHHRRGDRVSGGLILWPVVPGSRGIAMAITTGGVVPGIGVTPAVAAAGAVPGIGVTSAVAAAGVTVAGAVSVAAGVLVAAGLAVPVAAGLAVPVPAGLAAAVVAAAGLVSASLTSAGLVSVRPVRARLVSARLVSARLAVVGVVLMGLSRGRGSGRRRVTALGVACRIH